MSTFNPNDSLASPTQPTTKPVTPTSGSSSFGDTRVNTGGDTASAAGDIGAVIGSIGGSIAGVIVGAAGGPLMAALGGWIGGMIGAGLGNLIGEAIADGLDNDDATVWYSLSKEEQEQLVQALLIEAIVGLLPPGIAALVNKGPRLAGKAVGLKDKLFGYFASKAGGGAIANLAVQAGSRVIDETLLVNFGRQFLRISNDQQKKIWQELAESIQKNRVKEVDRLDYKAFRDTAEGGNYILPAFNKSLDIPTILKELASSPEGIKAINDWYNAKFTKQLLVTTGISGFLKGAAVSQPDTLNRGGLIAPIARPSTTYKRYGGLISM